MTATTSPSNVATYGGSIHSIALLTPPLPPSYASSEDVPFKPDDEDDVSLSMKRSRHKSHGCERRRLNRACLSSNDLQPSDTIKDQRCTGPRHCLSCPTLQQPRLHSFSHRNEACQTRAKSPAGHQRRWTLPSKATATRGVANTIAVNSKPGTKPRGNGGDDLSPAMITLRRATTCKPASRQMSLTFFPPPKFNRSRSRFLSFFVRTLNMMDKNRVWDTTTSETRGGRRASRTASIDSNKAQPAAVVSAPTVCTEIVGLKPNLCQPDGLGVGGTVRRCSTRYMTGDEVFEIIWDENHSSTASEATPTNPEAEAPVRRRSVAMEQLETQLFKAIAQSRRASLAVGLGCARSMSCIPAHASTQQEAFQRLSDFRFFRFASDAGLKSLPRSKASIGRKRPMAADEGIISSPQGMCRNRSDPTFAQIDFFPPLWVQATAATATDSQAGIDVERMNRSMMTANAPSKQRSPFGSLVGISTHRRRNGGSETWAPCNRGNVLFNAGESRRPSVWTQLRKRSSPVTDETLPLIGNLATVG